MSKNRYEYRVVKTIFPDGEEQFSIREVCFDPKNNPVLFVEIEGMYGDSFEELHRHLKKMLDLMQTTPVVERHAKSFQDA